MRRTTHAGLAALRMRTRADWRAWLDANHAAVDAVWLVFPRKELRKPSVRYDEAVEEALCYGWIDGVLNRLDDGWYGIRFSRRKAKSLWSKLNVARVERLREAGLMTAHGLAVYDAARSAGAIASAYAVSDPVEMPVQLRDALRATPGAAKRFAALSASQQRMWQRWVLSVKRAETRQRKAAEAVALIVAGRRAGETDAQAATRGLPARAEILRRR